MAVVLILGTAAGGLVCTGINMMATKNCYHRALFMSGDESEEEVSNLSHTTAVFSKCTEECLEALLEIGKDEANIGNGQVVHGQASLSKIGLVGDVTPTVNTCISSFEDNGLPVPSTYQGWPLAGYVTAIPNGKALAELGTKCATDARTSGCNFQTFATTELLVTAVVMAWLQICLVCVLRRSVQQHERVTIHPHPGRATAAVGDEAKGP